MDYENHRPDFVTCVTFPFGNSQRQIALSFFFVVVEDAIGAIILMHICAASGAKQAQQRIPDKRAGR